MPDRTLRLTTTATSAAALAATWWALRRIRDDIATVRSIVVCEAADLRAIRDTLKETP